MRTSPILGVVLLSVGLTGVVAETLVAATSEQAQWYVKKNGWADTLLATRQRYAAWWQEQLKGVKLGPWYATDRQVALAPEASVDLEAKDAKGNAIWKVRSELVDGVVHYDLSNHGIHEQRFVPKKSDGGELVNCLPDIPQSQATSFVYQVRTLEVDQPTKVPAFFGAQYGLEAWLNGKRLFSKRQMGNGLVPEPDQVTVEMSLVPGKNRLVVRFLGPGWSGFYFSLIPHDQIDPAPVKVLLELLARDYPIATHRMQGDLSPERIIAWFRDPGDLRLPRRLAEHSLEALKDHNPRLQAELTELSQSAATYESNRRLLNRFAKASLFRKAWTELERVNFDALRRAIQDLATSFPERYPRGNELMQRAETYQDQVLGIEEALNRGDENAVSRVTEIVAFQREALLSNPLLDFDRLLLIKRKPLGDPRRPSAPHRGMAEYFGLPQQSAWQLDRIRQPYGWENQIAVLSDWRGARRLTTLYEPPMPQLISDMDLHFDGRKMLFSMPGAHYMWQVFEIGTDGKNLRPVSLGDGPDVHNFDACYLPNGKIAFVSTAAHQGVPCSDGIAVASNYIMDADGRNVRQLCFDQDHDYCPTVMNDGRVLYLRWDYTDLPHQWPRILFTMNPDGTGQREYYGSNSYWPNAIFFARPIPGHPTKIAGIVTGHHVGRMGELVLFDPAIGSQEAGGVVQRIPGYGQKVEPVIKDQLTLDSWPKFTYPYPLSEKYFITSCKPTPDALWGIYLVDVFDNLVLLKEVEGYALFEATPLRKRETPPVIPDRIDSNRSDAVVYIEDIYRGPGLAGVPRGSVKRLRLFAYHFAYPYKSGGQHRVGTDGPWEPKRVLGTVPVEADGSALFRVPAKTPFSVQPLDSEGKALQLMRSWMTAMPGETVSCVGCHERHNNSPVSYGSLAARRNPSEIEPWYGPVRGFSFQYEVQPVLNKYCVACHDGSRQPNGRRLSDLRANETTFVVFKATDPHPQVIRSTDKEELFKKYSGVFDPAYVELRRFVRVGGLESDLHVLAPGEFHADTTELIQMLQKGHHGVRLDAEAWDRLVTWIDLNAPCHGTWSQTLGHERTDEDHRRRRELRQRTGGQPDDPELMVPVRPVSSVQPVLPRKLPVVLATTVDCPGWPFDAAEAQRRQASAGSPARSVDLGNGITLDLVRIPPGSFVMGNLNGCADELPPTRIRIDDAFWMSRCEVTNAQYAQFDPTHDSRHEHGTASFNSERAIGPPLNGPDQPVIRISWNEATAFCQWLSDRTGKALALPTEAQWEYACRAGSATPLFYGDVDTDFSSFANMADATFNGWATYNEKRRSADQVPRDARFNDHALVTTNVGSYRPNVWGLHDMHGNVWEWTRSVYQPYPYRADDGRNARTADGERVVRGGSWYDRPDRCRSAFRLSYPPWQKVYNVGFRIVCAATKKNSATGRVAGK